MNKTILVAEDIDSNYLLVKAILGKTYNLVRALNGLEALELFQSVNPDMIFMDIKMPKMSGIEATIKIREISKEVPIVALTAYAYDSDRDQALEVGCNDFLTKPLDRLLLIATAAKFTSIKE